MEEALNSGEGKEKWQEIVDAWRASGLGKTEFCRKQKVVASAFYYWCRKLENGSSRKPPKKKAESKPKRKTMTKEKTASKKKLLDDKPAFVEISIPKHDSASPATGQVFRITTSYGAVMEIPI
jgi:transposase-like protein